MNACWQTVDSRYFYTKKENAVSSFPELNITAATGLWQEIKGGILSFKTPQMEFQRH